MSDQSEDQSNKRYDSVVAKLKRAPQDEMQAAVVLEAWGGSKAPDSFAVEPPGGHDSDADYRHGSGRWDLGVRRIGEITVMATAVITAIIWLPMLRESYGYGAAKGVAWGLPLALAADSAVRTRYLGSGRVRSLHRSIVPLEAAIAASVLVVGTMHRAGMVQVPVSAMIAVSVAVIWGHVSILSGRGWFVAYCGVAAVGTLLLWLFNARLAVLMVVAGAVMGLALAAVKRAGGGQANRPESWLIAGAAGTIGAGCGIILVADMESLRTPSWIATLALILLTIAGWVGSIRLSRLWLDLPRQMEKLVLRRDDSVSVSGVFRRTTLGAVAVVVLPTVILVIAAALSRQDDSAPVLASYGLFTLACLVVSLNLVSKRWFVTAGVVAAAAVVALVLAQTLPGLALAGGSAIIVLVSGLIAMFTYRDAAATYSTRMML